MKRILTIINLVLFVALGSALQAQTCTFTSSKQMGCVGEVLNFQFTGTGNVATYSWAFGDGGTSNQPTPGYQYNTAGTFNPTLTVTFTDGTTCQSTGAPITIHAKPNANVILPNPTTMCFKNNSFNFTNAATPGPSGAAITSYYWDFGDGSVSSNPNPTKTYGSSGTFTIFFQVVDANQCQDTIELSNAITVLPSLGLNFTTQYTVNCPQTIVNFINNTNQQAGNIISWKWEFGDGEESTTLWNNFQHIYKKDGWFSPRLIATSGFGCTDTFTLTNGARNIFYYFDIKATPDTTCFTGNNILFEHTPRPNAFFWLWEFGDPDAGQDNFNNQTWTPTHRYVGGPGFYDVKLLIQEPNCTQDTTYCAFIALKGPAAAIQLPPPAVNNCVMYEPMPLSDFHLLKNPCYAQFLNQTTITYATIKTVAPYVYHQLPIYCFSDTLGTTVVNHNCDPALGVTVPGTFYNLNPTSFQNFYSTVALDQVVVWDTSQAIPTNAYTFPSGTCLKQTMHDSDLFRCDGPNLVTFTNNTMKYRLYDAIDNFPNAFGDTCKLNSLGIERRHYPWGSDSLIYFWDFSIGDACTSTVENPNIHCRFSTEWAPQHLFDEEGCWTVTLRVVDTMFQSLYSMPNCTSVATVSIAMEPPHAGWDTAEYDYLNWEMQKLLPATPRRGLMVNGRQCAGGKIEDIQTVDVSGILPSCEQQDYWILFDYGLEGGSIACDTINQDSIIVGNFIPKAILQQMNMQYMYQFPGCKTLVMVVENGGCRDTFVYKDYKFYQRVDPAFKIFDANTYPAITIPKETFCPPENLFLMPDSNMQDYIREFRYTVFNTTDPNHTPYDTFHVTDVKEVIYTISDTTDFYWDEDKDGNPIKMYPMSFQYPSLGCGFDPFEDMTLNDVLNMDPTYAVTNVTNILDLSKGLTINITEPGKYLIRADIFSFDNCHDWFSREIYVGHINQFFITDLMLNTDTVLCVGETIHFTDSLHYWKATTQAQPAGYDLAHYWKDPANAGGRTQVPQAPYMPEVVEWDFTGDGNINAIGSTPHSWTYNQVGTFPVTMHSTDSAGCRLSRTKNVHVVGVIAIPTLANLADSVLICAPHPNIGFIDQSITIDDNPNPGNLLDSIVYWHWDFGDGKTPSLLQHPVHTYTYPGKYTITLTVRNSQGCEHDSTFTFVDVRGPQPDFEIIGPDSGCAPFALKVRILNDEVDQFLWKLGYDNKTVSTFNVKGDTVELIYTKPGEWFLNVTGTANVLDANGNPLFCSIDFPDPTNPNHPIFKITVFPVDPVDFTISDTTLCPNETTHFVETSHPDYDQFFWDFGDGNSGTGASISHSYASPGIYNVMLTATGAKCLDTMIKKVYVDSVVADFVIDENKSGVDRFHFVNQSLNGTQFKWSFGDGRTETVNTMQDMEHRYATTGSFTVCLTVTNQYGCEDIKCMEINIVSSVKFFNVFTPGSGGINETFGVEIEGELEYHLTIFNRWGQKMFETNNKNIEWDGTTPSGADAPSGTYYFICNYRLAGEESKTQTGTVTLIR